MAFWKILSLIVLVFVVYGSARQKEPRNRVFHSSRVFNRHKNLLKRHVNVDDAVNKVHHSSKRSEKVEESENEGWQRKAHENKIIFKQYSVQGNTGSPYPNTTTHRISVVPLGKPTDTSESNTVEPHNRKPPTNPEETPSSTENPPVPGTEGGGVLPTFEEFQKGVNVPSDGKTFHISDTCKAHVRKIDSRYQITPQPLDCVNLGILLAKVLPKGKVNFQSTIFMSLEKIIIKTVSLDTSTKRVEIAAIYEGTATLIKDILTISDIHIALSFVWTRSQEFQFDISASFSIGDAPIHVNLIRNKEGYFFIADSTYNFTVKTINRMFKKEDDFLPSILLKSKLKQDNFDKFKLINPRLRAAFTEGYGIVFGGSMQILDWKHFEVNILINKPNDEPTTVTIAVFIPSFSVPKLLNDLFEIDISNVPVLGNATVRNLAFSMSTNNVETPLTVLDIGSEYSFDIPYREGLKISFQIPIGSVDVSASIRITSTLITLSVSRNNDLTLGDVMQAFIPNSKYINTTGDTPRLKYWPSFIPNPLSIGPVLFDLKASSQVNEDWGLSTMNMKVKITQTISLFGDRIHIKDLELKNLNYKKVNESSSFSGELTGKITIGNDDSNLSPRVDVRIPYPFIKDKISFTFTNFTVKSVVQALANDPNLFPSDFQAIFDNLRLDQIVVAFKKEGGLKSISVDASIPGLWNIFGDFSIGDVTIHFEYGEPSNNSSSDADSNALSHTDQLHDSSKSSKWRLIVKGKIIIATCKIDIATNFQSGRVEVTADGSRCSVSVADVMDKFGRNGINLPSLISGFTIFSPQVKIIWQRSGPDAGKALSFTARTSLFHQSIVELALIKHGQNKSTVVAGFEVEANALTEINFLKSLGLQNVAVIYVSEKVPITPYVFYNPTFQKYIRGEDSTPDTPKHSGITIYAKFVPKNDDMLGRILNDGMAKDPSLSGPEIIVEISFPELYFALVVDLGEEGLQIGDIKGWSFTYMKLVISKRLIGLELKCKISLGDSSPSIFTGGVSFTFTGTVTVSMLWEGKWANPFGISSRLTVYRLGLALGINIVDLIPSFGITGGIEVKVPSLNNDDDPIKVNLTLCIDPSNPDSTVFELQFTRLLLEDVINLFAKDPVDLPSQLAQVGFPDEVRLYISPDGNDDCFGKKYESGIEIHGTLQIPFLKIRARIDLSLKLKPKFKLDAAVYLDPIIYLDGLLKIVHADSDDKGAYLKMFLTETLTELRIEGSCRIEIFGAMISISLKINSKELYFNGELNLWNLFRVHLLVDISLTGTEKSPGVHVIGEMQNDLFSKLKQKASQAIQAGARGINEKIGATQGKILDAEREVNSLLDSIKEHEEKISEEKNKCKKAPWYKKYICIASGAEITYHGVIIAGLWVAHEAALGVLEAARLFLKAAQAVIKVGADVVQKLVNAALSIIDIQYVKFEITLDKVTRVFKFKAKVVILDWTFTPEFNLDFSSSESANEGINSAGQSIANDTMKEVET